MAEEDSLDLETAVPAETADDGFSHARGARKPPTPHEGRPRQRTGSSTSYKALLADTQQELILPGRNERRDRAKDRDTHHARGSGRDASGSGRFHRSEGHSVGQENKGLKKKVQAKQVVEKQEKEVYIPSTVTVQRLAGIFGMKLCESGSSTTTTIVDVQTRCRRRCTISACRRTSAGQITVGRAVRLKETTLTNAVLTAEEACNLALERNLNPIIDDEAAFDIIPE